MTLFLSGAVWELPYFQAQKAQNLPLPQQNTEGVNSPTSPSYYFS
jgi:hypothetical protein